MSDRVREVLVQIGASVPRDAELTPGPDVIRATTALEAAVQLAGTGELRVLMMAPPDLIETLRLIEIARNVLHLPIVAIDVSGDQQTERCLRLAGVSAYHCGASARAMIERFAAGGAPSPESSEDSGVFLLLRQDGEGHVNRISSIEEV